MSWNEVAREEVHYSTGLLPTVKATLVITVHDTNKASGFRPGIGISIHAGKSTDNSTWLYGSGPGGEPTGIGGKKHIDELPGLIGERLEYFVGAIDNYIERKHMEQSDQARIEQHVEMAATSDTIDEIFARVDALKEVSDGS